MYIDPGDNPWNRWIDSLKPGDPVAHVDGRVGELVEIYEHGGVCVRCNGLRFWLRQEITQPPHPDLIALAARMPEEL